MGLSPLRETTLFWAGLLRAQSLIIPWRLSPPWFPAKAFHNGGSLCWLAALPPFPSLLRKWDSPITLSSLSRSFNTAAAGAPAQSGCEDCGRETLREEEQEEQTQLHNGREAAGAAMSAGHDHTCPMFHRWVSTLLSYIYFIWRRKITRKKNIIVKL